MSRYNSPYPSPEEDHQELPDRLYAWAVQKWPTLLLRTGLALFWLACINSWRLPIEALFVGPAMMVAGVAMTVRNKRESSG
jgi:hypothetical protein